MAELSTADNWTLSQLMTAAEKFTFADGKADINETRALIGLVHPFAEVERDIADFEKMLVDIAEDGVVTPEESAALAAAIASLRTKFQTADAVYDARHARGVRRAGGGHRQPARQVPNVRRRLRCA